MNITDCLGNLGYTENGALGYKSSGNAYTDLTYNLSSFRDDPKPFVDVLLDKLGNDYEFAIRFLFWVRDAREGLGEKNVFISTMACFLANVDKNITPVSVARIVDAIGFYGCYKDVIAIYDMLPRSSNVRRTIAGMLLTKIVIERKLIERDPKRSISLLSKWMPTVNSSVTSTKKLARNLLHDSCFNISEKYYRQTISMLRRHLNVIEQKMATRHWNDIDYSLVPSKANILYRNAFMHHDLERRLQYLQDVKDGKRKLNMSVTMPYEIIHSCLNQNSDNYNPDLAETYWKNLKDIGFDSTLVVADVSGSMMSSVNSQNSCTMYTVAQSLAIYCSEHLDLAYRDKIIVFSANPYYLDLSKCTSLADKVDVYSRATEWSNTDIAKTMRLILKTAVSNHLLQSELPKNILIISDMEFDNATWDEDGDSKYATTYFEHLEKEFASKGYKMPRIIFWNLCSRTGTIPMIKSLNGLLLVSGFSPNVIKMFQDDCFDTFKAIQSQVNSVRYDQLKGLIELKIEE